MKYESKLILVKTRLLVLTSVRWRQHVRTSHSGWRHRTPAQYVGQHGGTLYVFYQQRDHGGQFVFAQRVAERTGPVYVVNGRMSVLQKKSIVTKCNNN